MEILLIGLIVWGLVTLIPIIVQSSNFRLSQKAAKKIDPIFRLTMTNDGKNLWVQRGYSEIVSVELETGKTQSVYHRNDPPIISSHFSGDGATYMMALDDWRIVILRNNGLLISEQVPEGVTVNLFLSVNGKTAVRVLSGTQVRCWDLSSSDPTWSDYELADSANRIALDPQGVNLVIATKQGGLDLHDAKTGVRLKTLADSESVMGDPAFSEDGQWLAVTGGQAVSLYDMRSCEIAWKVKTGAWDDFQNVAISQDGKLVAAAGCLTGLQILDRSGELLHKFAPSYVVNKMVFSPSNDLLYMAAASLGSIQVWSLSTGQELAPIDAI